MSKTNLQNIGDGIYRVTGVRINPITGKYLTDTYTPTTEAVRSSFASNQFVQRGEFEFELLAEDEAGVAFDAWLAAHDAEVAGKALREVAEKFGENQMIREGDVKEWLRARAAEYRKAVES